MCSKNTNKDHLFLKFNSPRLCGYLLKSVYLTKVGFLANICLTIIAFHQTILPRSRNPKPGLVTNKLITIYT